MVSSSSNFDGLADYATSILRGGGIGFDTASEYVRYFRRNKEFRGWDVGIQNSVLHQTILMAKLGSGFDDAGGVQVGALTNTWKTGKFLSTPRPR